MHESHHRPREGPFELNDVFAIINAAPAIALLAYGFFHSGLVPGLCFGVVSHASIVVLDSVCVGLLVGPLTLHDVCCSHRASGLRC
jgi:hypothetical protein